MATRGGDSDAMIDAIYASIVDASSVGDMQRMLSVTLDAPVSTLMRIDESVTAVALVGFDPTSMQSYRDHYHRTDPWIAAGMTVPFGVGVNVEHLVPRERYLQSEFYHDFMKTHVNATQLLGVMIAADDSRYALTFMRVDGQPDYDDAQERRFARWAPHLRRAFATRARVDRQLREAAGPDPFHADADVVHVLVTSDLTVRWTNRADMHAVPGVVIRYRPSGPARLEAWTSHTQCDLLRAVSEATVRHPPLSGAVRLGDDFILVDPCVSSDGSELLALLHLPNRAATEARAIERASGVFGLTAAEAALCRRLMHGDTIEAHAAAMGLSTWTVRTHLRNVFGKTGTVRQAELVALLCRLAR
jgi:DNA-binding CsgD family transcriptional regulator